MNLTEDVLKKVSQIFIGDIGNTCFKYKTGYEIINFFNKYFNYNDIYDSSFGSRWAEVSKRIFDVKLEKFLNVIFSHNYLISEEGFYGVEIQKNIIDTLNTINKEVESEHFKIKEVDGVYSIIPTYWEQIGKGGFANIYKIDDYTVIKQLSTGSIKYKNRFVREFQTMQDLQSVDGIVRVFDFSSDTNSYKMKFYQNTLETYLNNNTLSEKEKIDIVEQLLEIMSQVHEKNIKHRDLTPWNIFVEFNKLYIGDFGLAKDDTKEYSKITNDTNSLGSYEYAAPEQFDKLKNTSYEADVYSVGKIINFIFTKSPKVTNHLLRELVIKSTAENSNNRFSNCGEQNIYFNKFKNQKLEKLNEQKIINQIERGTFDENSRDYILSLSEDKLNKFILENNFFYLAVIDCISSYKGEALDICGKLLNYENYNDKYGAWYRHDYFGAISLEVLNNDSYSYDIKIEYAKLLAYVAWIANRFAYQDRVKELIDKGIDPTLEDLIDPNERFHVMK